MVDSGYMADNGYMADSGYMIDSGYNGIDSDNVNLQSKADPWMLRTIASF